MARTTALFAPNGALRRTLRRLPEAAVDSGLPPAWLGYRWVARESVPGYFRRRAAAPSQERTAGEYETIHPPAVAANALPRNVRSAEELPADRGWWGYSFRDVPARASGETFRATLRDCRVCWYRDGANDFHVAILNADGRALSLREIAFRPGHGRVLRDAPPPARIERATWILERVYHNYSHWLTAHVTKLCLLRARGELDGVILPPDPGGFLAGSLRMLGIDLDEHPTFDPARPLEVGELTIVGLDRFRPEPLRAVRDALGAFRATPGATPGRRRVFVSRKGCARRRLVDEDRLWPRLRAEGFERFALEDLSFEEQVRLMGETAILLAPHGAGLTNALFCAPGTHVVEIADLGFPNPNFYALASAMGHHYWLIRADSVGAGHPLEKDLRVAEHDVAAVLTEFV